MRWQLSAGLNGVTAVCCGLASASVWRGRHPALPAGPAPVADVKERQRQAVEINDDIVQGLATIAYAAELGDMATVKAAADRALGSARRVVDELVGPEGTPGTLGAGDLRRARPSGGVGVSAAAPPAPRRGD